MKGLALGLVGALVLVAGCSGDGGGGNGGDGGAGGGGTAGSGGSGGGGVSCTEIGCDDGFFLTIQPESGTFADGDYVIDTEIDGVADTCTITIGAMVQSDCNALIDVSNTPNRIDILFGGMPASITVVITQNATELANVTFMPSYMEVQPNGEGCPPVCQQASGEISL